MNWNVYKRYKKYKKYKKYEKCIFTILAKRVGCDSDSQRKTESHISLGILSLAAGRAVSNGLGSSTPDPSLDQPKKVIRSLLKLRGLVNVQCVRG